MSDPRSGAPRWRHHLRRAGTTGGALIADAARWDHVEVDAVRLITAGVSLALPITAGLLGGDLAAGMVAALGALLVSTAGHQGTARECLADVRNTIVAGSAGVLIGMIAGGPRIWSSVVLIAVAVLVAVAGGIRPSAAKAGVQSTIFMILGASLDAGHVPIAQSLGYFALGACVGGLLTLIVFVVEYHVLHRHPLPEPAPARSWSEDLRAWRQRLSEPAGRQYPARLTSCMIVAEVLAHLVRGQHSYWILLTVVLCVQRDHLQALSRTVQRGLGTLLGVLAGALVLTTIPTWAMVVVIGVIGAARVYLKFANYTAYALVMTPMVVVFSGLGHTLSSGLLRERLVDTAIGCLISLVVGYLPWRRPWTATSEPEFAGPSMN
ncbi:MAG: FUSC family protein [Nocardia sp.]|nr:FUSC family protein [Nocardia sp.]